MNPLDSCTVYLHFYRPIHFHHFDLVHHFSITLVYKPSNKWLENFGIRKN
jgi:hypothetical protein